MNKGQKLGQNFTENHEWILNQCSAMKISTPIHAKPVVKDKPIHSPGYSGDYPLGYASDDLKSCGMGIGPGYFGDFY